MVNFVPSIRCQKLKPWPINTGKAGKKNDPVDLKRVVVWNIGKFIVRIYKKK